MRSELLPAVLLGLAACRPVTPWEEVVVATEAGWEDEFTVETARAALLDMGLATGLVGSWVSTVVVERPWTESPIYTSDERPAAWQRDGGVVRFHSRSSFGIAPSLRNGVCRALEDQHRFTRELGELPALEEGDEGWAVLPEYCPTGDFELFAWYCAQPRMTSVEQASLEVCGVGELDPTVQAVHELVYSADQAEVVLAQAPPELEELALVSAEENRSVWAWTPVEDGVQVVLMEYTEELVLLDVRRWSDAGVQTRCADVDPSELVPEWWVGAQPILGEDHLLLTGRVEDQFFGLSLDLDTCSLTPQEFEGTWYAHPPSVTVGEWALAPATVNEDGLYSYGLLRVDLRDGTTQAVPGDWSEQIVTGLERVGDQVLVWRGSEVWSWSPATNEITELEHRLELSGFLWLPLTEDRWLHLWALSGVSYPVWGVQDLEAGTLHMAPEACEGLEVAGAYRAADEVVWVQDYSRGFVRMDLEGWGE